LFCFQSEASKTRVASIIISIGSMFGHNGRSNRSRESARRNDNVSAIRIKSGAELVKAKLYAAAIDSARNARGSRVCQLSELLSGSETLVTFTESFERPTEFRINVFICAPLRTASDLIGKRTMYSDSRTGRSEDLNWIHLRSGLI